MSDWVMAELEARRCLNGAVGVTKVTVTSIGTTVSVFLLLREGLLMLVCVQSAYRPFFMRRHRLSLHEKTEHFWPPL